MSGCPGGTERAPSWYAVSSPCSHEEFLAAVKVYARDVVAEHDLAVSVSDLDWEVSTRAKRRAGVLRHGNGEPLAVRLAWRLFENRGWEPVASTVRHELIHAHLVATRGDGGHGPAFERLASRLDTSVHCERFTEPEWWVDCTDCAVRLARYRESRLVREPGRFECGNCGGRLVVERNE